MKVERIHSEADSLKRQQAKRVHHDEEKTLTDNAVIFDEKRESRREQPEEQKDEKASEDENLLANKQSEPEPKRVDVVV